jgi:hypothetical protein
MKNTVKLITTFASICTVTLSCSIPLASLHAQSLSVNTTGVTAHASAILDVSSANKGILIPRVALTGTTDLTTIASPANSLLVYNTAAISNVTPGYYYWSGSAWTKFVTGTAWSLRGNSGTIADTNFLGTTDNVSLVFKVNNQRAGLIQPLGSVFLGHQAGNTNPGTENVGIGLQALFSNVNGVYNTAVGSTALSSNTSGSFNTATGYWAMAYNIAGVGNTANGWYALGHNDGGSYNTAMGYEAMNNSFNNGDNNSAVGVYALKQNTTGDNNSAVGMYALSFNNAGTENTATGYQALYNNSTGNYNTANGTHSLYNNNGNYNTANGYYALSSNGTGENNTASGNFALGSNSVGSENTATGYESLAYNGTGFGNTANGAHALRSNTSGTYNTAMGYNALKANGGSYNTSVGYASMEMLLGNDGNTAIGAYAGTASTNGTNNTLIGYNAAFTNGVSNATAIGNNALVSTSNSLVLGDINNISVGIGVSNPSDVLHVKGVGEHQVTIEAYAVPVGLLLKEGGADVARIQHTGSYLEIEDYYAFSWAPVGLVINQGDVGIGTTGPTAKLSVNGSANNATGVWGVFSDERVKTITGEFTDGLNIIKQIHPVKFNYNEKAPYKTSNEQVGIVAQELEKIAPYMVNKKAYDNFSDLREVNNQAYVFLLINAVKEQQVRIEELEKKVESLSREIK